MRTDGDYISREAVIALAKDICVPTKWDSEYRHRSIDPLDVIELPAADVRPVVVCRDCTYCRKGKASLECEKHTYAWNNTNRWVEEDDFCSWGVMREKS